MLSKKLLRLPVCLTFLLFFLAVPAAGQEGTDTNTRNGDTISVVSFNIRFDNPADGENSWPHRKEKVANLLLSFRVDLAGLQEALEHQIDDLSEFMPGYAWIGAGRDDGKSAGEYCPIFYLRDRFELLEQGVFWLSETPDAPGGLAWDAACRRIVTWGKFRDAKNDKSIFLFNTHFDHKGEEARVESAKLLLAKVEQIAGGSPVLVTGDFNCRPDSRPYAILTALETALDEDDERGLRDAYLDCLDGPFGPRWTFHGFTGNGEEGNRIDYIFHNNKVRVTRLQILPEPEGDSYRSDHLPVLAEIRVQQ